MNALDLQTIAVRQTDGVAWLTLNRPQALNAWTLQLARELTRALDDVSDEPEVRAIVITGAGRAFSSGADLRERAGDDADVGSVLERVYNPLIMRVRTVGKPVVAAVNGPAVGIGCSLALACDLIVAARSAYFLMAFVNIGLGLDGGASQTLTARLGHARAFEIAYLGERIGAEQALFWGLINQVVDDGELETSVAALAARLAAGPPRSYAAIKRTLNHRAYDGFERQLALEAEVQRGLLESGDFAEGVAAFLQKRPPRFTGA